MRMNLIHNSFVRLSFFLVLMGALCCLLYPICVFYAAARHMPKKWKDLPTATIYSVERVLGDGEKGFGEEVWRRNYWWGSQELHVSHDDNTEDGNISNVYCDVHLTIPFHKEHADDESQIGNIYLEQLYPKRHNAVRSYPFLLSQFLRFDREP